MHRGSAGAACVLVDTALAIALGNSSVFVPLLVIGPLVAAALASPRCTVGVAVLARRLRDPAGPRRPPLPLGRAHRRGGGGRRRRRAGRARRQGPAQLRGGAAQRARGAPALGLRRHAPGNCSTRRPSPRRCCARSCGWPCPTWPSCASWTSCTTARWARRPPTPPTRARWRCCTPRASRYPLDPGGPHPVAVVARTGRPHLQHEIGAERLRAFAVDEQHLKLMAGAGYATSLAVPLDRPRAHDRRAELHALRRRAALRRRGHRARPSRSRAAPRWPSTTRACSPSCAAPRASSRRSSPTSRRR